MAEPETQDRAPASVKDFKFPVAKKNPTPRPAYVNEFKGKPSSSGLPPTYEQSNDYVSEPTPSSENFNPPSFPNLNFNYPASAPSSRYTGSSKPASAAGPAETRAPAKATNDIPLVGNIPTNTTTTLPTGESNSSNPVGSSAAAPLNLTAVGLPGVVSLSWSAVASDTAITYSVERSTSPATGFVALTTGLSGTTYDDSSVVNGTTYYYRVASLNTAGGAYSNIASAMISSVPTTPTLVVAAANGSASLTWGASTGTGPITYSIERSLTASTGFSPITTALSSTLFTDSSVVNGTLYYYRVQAHNPSGPSNYSAEVTAKSIDAFLMGTATAGGSEVAVTWNSATGASTYDVQYGTTSGTYTTTLSNKTSPFTVTGLTAGTQYFFSVTAKNTDHGLTLSTNELSATPLGAFTITSIAASELGKLTVTWAASTGATSYDIGCSTTSGTYTTLTFTNQTSPATLSGFSNASTYYCMVTAKNTIGSLNASAEGSATTYSVLTYTWPFDVSTDSSYTFNSSKLELVGGVSRLKNITPTDSSNIAEGFLSATLSGVKFDGAKSKIVLDSTSSTGSLNSLWTPQYNKIAGYWKFENIEGAGHGTVVNSTIGPDLIAQNADQNGLRFVDGIQGKALSFDGVDDYLKLSRINTTFDMGLSNQTISMWVKFSGTADHNLISKSRAAGENGRWFLTWGTADCGVNSGDGTRGFWMAVTSPTGGVQCTSIVPGYNDNLWHHVTGVWDRASNMSLYVDGVLKTTLGISAAAGDNLSNNDDLYIGQYANSSGIAPSTNAYYKGEMDDIAIWKSSLSATEVKTIFERQRSRFTGTILSRVMDSGASTAWSGISYLTTLPYGKDILPSTTSEDQYPQTAAAFTGSLATGLVGHWHFDETSGTTVTDSSGTGNTGTLVNAPTLNAEGMRNTGMSFNPGATSNQRVELASPLVTGTSDFTIGGWFKATDINAIGYIAGNYDAGYNDGIEFYHQTGTVGVYIAGTYVFSPKILNSNQWYHLAATRTSGLVRIYLDGALIHSATAAASIPGAKPFVFGNGPSYITENFKGNLDEFAVWNRALSATDIKNFYEATHSVSGALAGLWHLNEATITTTAGLIKDASSYAQHATASAALTSVETKRGRGVSFDGTEKYITLPANTLLNTIDQQDYSVSVWYTPDGERPGAILGKAGFHEGLTYDGNSFMYQRWNASNGAMSVYAPASFDQTHHVVAVISKTNGVVKLYVDGVFAGEDYFAAGEASRNYGTTNWMIGTICPGCGGFTGLTNGIIDDVGIWARPLSDVDVQNLYQRGSSRIAFQARTCSSADCSDDATGANWRGSSGTAGSYFSELNNQTSGVSNATAPNFLFSNFGFSLTNQPYFQYRAILESDDANFSPEIISVSAGPARYDGSNPTIIPVNGPKFQFYTGFTTTLGASCSGTPRFQLSHDKQTWYYYASGMWNTTTAGVTQASDSATINSNIGTLSGIAGTGELYAKIFYPSNTSTLCEIDSVVVTGADSATSSSSNPGAFRLLTANATDSQVYLAWNPSSGATSYKICYGTSLALMNACATSMTRTPASATVTGLTNTTLYYFNVIATNASGTTALTSPVSATPIAIPSVPTSLAATAGLYSTQLNWTAASGSGVISYTVLRSTTSGGPYSAIASGVTSPAYTDLTALAGTTYYYVVQSSNASGSSANSNEAAARAIGAFWLLTAAGTDGKAILTWGAAAGATSYDILYGTTSGTYSTTVANQTSGATITGLTNNTSYYFVIQAKNATGSALNSGEVRIIPILGYTITATPLANAITISMSNAATGATSSSLSYGTSPGNYTTNYADPIMPFTISSLVSGTTYYFKHTSYNVYNGIYKTTEISMKPFQNFTYSWSYNRGDTASYAFSSSTLLSLTEGVCKMTNLTPWDDFTQWNTPTLDGLTYSLGNRIQITNGTSPLSSTINSQYNTLVGYWKMDGSLNNTVANNGLVTATVGQPGAMKNANGTGATYVEGKQSSALSFDGVDDSMTIADNGWNPGTNDFSLSYWIKMKNPTVAARIFGKRPDCSHGSFFATHVDAGGIAKFELDEDTAGTNYLIHRANTANVADDRWHFLTFVRQGYNTSIYVDGHLESTEVHAFITNISNTTAFDVAHLNGSLCGSTGYASVTLDELAVWGAALTPANIRNTYERQLTERTGTLLSRVIDAGSAIAWTGFNWFTSLPSGKELVADNVEDYRAIEPPLNGLIAHYRFEETTNDAGGNFFDYADSSGNDNRADNYSDSLSEFGVQGKIGRGIKNRGGKVRANLPAGSFSSNVATVSLWMNWDGSAKDSMVFGFNNYDLMFFNGRIGFNTGNSDLYGMVQPSLDNRWVHVVAEFHSTDITLNKLYFDGVQQTLVQIFTTPEPTNMPLTNAVAIGGWGRDNGYPFSGRFDDVAIFNRALTPLEVTQLAGAKSNLMAGNIGLWHFNETAAGTGPSGSDFKDDSGYGNHGVITSGVEFNAAGKFGAAAKANATGAISMGSSNLFNVNDQLGFSGWYYIDQINPTTGDNILVNKEAVFEVNAHGTFQYALNTNTTPWYWVDTGVAVPIKKWFHFAITYDSGAASGQVKVYLNGSVVKTDNYTGTFVPAASTLQIGSRSSGVDFHNMLGLIDEVGLWSRAITADEVKQLYRRGVENVFMQVRTCTTASCSDDPNGLNWKGPDGTERTYFSEGLNKTSGAVNASSPHFLFSNFALGSLTTAQYFQYRAVMTSENAFVSPELTRVETGPARYPASTENIYPVNGSAYLTITNFDVTLGDLGCTGVPKFLFSKDKTTWYYFDGSAWAVSNNTYAQANTAALANTNIATLHSTMGIGTIYVKAFLTSNGTAACEIDEVKISGTKY